jgi:hypothetical protein
MLPVEAVPVHVITISSTEPVTEMAPPLPVVPAKPSNGAPIVNEHPVWVTVTGIPTRAVLQCSVIVHEPDTSVHSPPPPPSDPARVLVELSLHPIVQATSRRKR